MFDEGFLKRPLLSRGFTVSMKNRSKPILHHAAQGIVQHPYFDIFFAAVVITNSLFIGFEVSMADPATGRLQKISELSGSGN